MTSDVAKTISTCTIWLATAISLAGGLFTMRGWWDAAFYVVTTAIIVGAAVGATAVVWHAKVAKSHRAKSPLMPRSGSHPKTESDRELELERIPA
jgi:hypothetical protein